VLSLVATAVVAVEFQPVRARVQAFANRLVYGDRATPYEVLSRFAEDVAGTYSADEVLLRMARVLGEGTAASRAQVWLRVGSELRAAATWPEDGTTASPVSVRGETFPRIPRASKVEAATSVAPVRHQGMLLGALVVMKPPYEPLAPAEKKLLADLAAQAGLVLRNVALIEEVRASRQRLVTAQDEERRRLERNLHDGAQQDLVALGVKLRLLGPLSERDPTGAASLAEQLKNDADRALENLRDLARGIYPPLLVQKGLAAALEAQARRAVIPVSIDADSDARYPQEVEAAVYFCCLEALQNVAKYAGASKAAIRLSSDDGELRFEVEDDGTGFDPSAVNNGSGLQGMADRLDALGGALVVRSEPGGGTTIMGRVPTRTVP
jgi:signal transduction histidine kinase